MQGWQQFNVSMGRDDLPDTGVVCCYGVAVYGPERCTCWEPVYDLEQAEPDTSAPAIIGRECCRDCAFRADSPERKSADGYKYDAEDLEELVASPNPFYCMKGCGEC